MCELLKINVNDHVEKKGQLSYLSWAWAWAEVLKLDPGATWVAHEFGPDGCQIPMMVLPDSTAMVKVGVTLKGAYKQCLLPVMDNRNNAIVGPNAMDVNKAIMRCLAKAIAMHGLGLYIYSGEDLPESDVNDAIAAITASKDVAILKSHFAAAWKLFEKKAERDAIKTAYDVRTKQLTPTKEAA
jgi:hypothetical protein